MGLRRGRTMEQKGGRENTSSDLWSLVSGSAASRQALRFVYCITGTYLPVVLYHTRNRNRPFSLPNLRARVVRVEILIRAQREIKRGGRK